MRLNRGAAAALMMILCLTLILPAGAEGIRSYDKADGGWQYVTMGVYPYEADGAMRDALLIENPEHVQTPFRLGGVQGQVGQGGHQQGKSDGAQDPHGDRPLPMENQGNGAEGQVHPQDGGCR